MAASASLSGQRCLANTQAPVRVSERVFEWAEMPGDSQCADSKAPVLGIEHDHTKFDVSSCIQFMRTESRVYIGKQSAHIAKQNTPELYAVWRFGALSCVHLTAGEIAEQTHKRDR